MQRKSILCAPSSNQVQNTATGRCWHDEEQADTGRGGLVLAREEGCGGRGGQMPVGTRDRRSGAKLQSSRLRVPEWSLGTAGGRTVRGTSQHPRKEAAGERGSPEICSRTPRRALASTALSAQENPRGRRRPLAGWARRLGAAAEVSV